MNKDFGPNFVGENKTFVYIFTYVNSNGVNSYFIHADTPIQAMEKFCIDHAMNEFISMQTA